jgi:GWxTD domain-containing protein
MKKTVLSIIVLLISSSAAAQISERFSGYFEGPEGFLLTKKEKKVWKNVSSDAEAEEFIALFWARRDPDLSTAVNEFRLDFDQRVEAADRLFGFETTRGALSDRARVLILLGACSRRDNRPPDTDANSVRDPNVAAGTGSGMLPSDSLYENRGSTEIWEYLGAELPVPFNQYFLHAVFLETNVDDNDYILDRSNAPLMHVLGGAPDALVSNPDLTEAPELGLIPGTRPASDEQKGWFALDENPWPDAIPVIATSGVAPGPSHFLWVHLELDENTAGFASIVGRVRDSEMGEELGSFVIPAQDVTIAERTMEFSVPVVEGEWLLDIALSGETGPLQTGTFNVETARTPDGRTVVAPFVWGVDVRQVPDSKLGDPFNIAGWRVEPMLHSRFLTSSGGNLSYMAYVFDPELDAEGNPQFSVSISLSKEGQLVAKTEPQPAPLNKLAEGTWLFGRGLPLERFSQPGLYVLTVVLEQTTDGARGFVEIPFEMVEKETVSDETM